LSFALHQDPPAGFPQLEYRLGTAKEANQSGVVDVVIQGERPQGLTCNPTLVELIIGGKTAEST
jgi:hypothetical protein